MDNRDGDLVIAKISTCHGGRGGVVIMYVKDAIKSTGMEIESQLECLAIHILTPTCQ